MSDTTIAIILGLVEGITEYLPVSSTGHLILFGEALSFSDEKAKTFDVVIQLGAILSVAVLYWNRFKGLLSGLTGGSYLSRALSPGLTGASGIVKLALVSLPALVIGFLTRHAIKEHLFSAVPVAVALAVGAVLILLVERRAQVGGGQDADELSWKQALAIGCFQCLALWPGMSRSASAIVGGMLVGLNRKAAAEFSFLAAVPILAAAALADLFTAMYTFSFDDLKLVAIGFGVSFVTALLTVKWFIGMVSRWTLKPFAYYRIVVAIAVLALLGWR